MQARYLFGYHLQKHSSYLRINWISSLKRHLPLLVLKMMFFIVAALIFLHKGVIISNDSARYIGYANNINQGNFYDDFNFWYVSYAIFLSFFTFFTDNFLYAVVAQHILSFVAILSLYGTAVMLWKSRLAAFCGCFLFIVFLEPLIWNAYVLTESLYVSFICFSIYVLSLLYTKQRNKWIITLTISTVVFTFFLRPNGICLVGSVILLLSISIIQKTSSPWKKAAIGLAVSTFLLILADKMLANFGLIENYRKGEVIYAITTLEMRPEWQHLVVTPPKDIVVIDSDSQIIKVSFFFFQHPVYFIELATKKAFYFFMHIRPYWSTTHNIFSGCILFSCYLSVAILLFKKRVSSTVAQFSLLFIILQAISVCLTSDDWDGRFLMPILPVIFLLAGKQFASWMKVIYKKWQSNAALNVNRPW